MLTAEKQREDEAFAQSVRRRDDEQMSTDDAVGEVAPQPDWATNQKCYSFCAFHLGGGLSVFRLTADTHDRDYANTIRVMIEYVLVH